jgi:hypothetical protein
MKDKLIERTEASKLLESQDKDTVEIKKSKLRNRDRDEIEHQK